MNAGIAGGTEKRLERGGKGIADIAVTADIAFYRKQIAEPPCQHLVGT